MARRKCVGSGILGKKSRRTLNVCRRLQTLIEIDLPRKAYCSLLTDAASYGTDTASYGTDTVSYGTSTVIYGLSGKKGLPAQCSILIPVSSVGVRCCDATRTVLSLLSHTLHNYKDPLQKLPQALC